MKVKYGFELREGFRITERGVSRKENETSPTTVVHLPQQPMCKRFVQEGALGTILLLPQGLVSCTPCNQEPKPSIVVEIFMYRINCRIMYIF